MRDLYDDFSLQWKRSSQSPITLIQDKQERQLPASLCGAITLSSCLMHGAGKDRNKL